MAVLKEYKEEQERKDILKEYRALLRIARPMMKTGDSERIRRAFELAAEAHKDMRRKSGEPYILHPLAVAKIVAQELGLGVNSIIGALMHDTVEDTHVTLEDIESEFDHEIMVIIDGLTKIGTVTHHTNIVASQAENLKKIMLSISEDVRVILIKLADRLHNMRTLGHMPEHKQFKIASETLYIYSPVAHRLGLYNVKSELEDLSLKYTASEVYKEINDKLTETEDERQEFIKEFIEPVKKSIRKLGIENFKIYGRPKTIYSIWNKMKKKKVPFESIYDLFAIRIVVDSSTELEKSECWQIYSVVTDIYRPNPDRLRDWISNPKSNGYESLHTTVMGPRGQWVEVQVRTKRMDEIAEKGLAAHWKYKDGEGGKQNALDEWIMKIREFLADPAANALDFMNDFKHNLYETDLYVFTPKGDLRTIPNGSSVLDFAFAIHTDIGCACIGAKINGKLYPISHKLANGEQVEILTSKKQKPNKDWLNFSISSKARSKIKSQLKEDKKKIAEDGKGIFMRKMKAMKIKPDTELIEEMVSHFQQGDLLNFYFNIAQKNFDLNELKKLTIVGGKLKVLREKKVEEKEEHLFSKTPANNELLILGFADKVDYTISPCCRPVAGDDVFGFITINSGIKIHSTKCPNASDLISKYSYRIVRAKWSEQSDLTFHTTLRVTGIDDVGLINKLTTVISDKLKVNMRSLSFDATDGVFEGKISVFVKHNKELSKLIKALKAVEGVYEVRRFEG